MKKLLMPLLCMALLLGCQKEQQSSSPLPGQQIVDVEPGEIEVCRRQTNAFDHYELHAPAWADSIEWKRYVGNSVWVSLGTDTLLLLPVAEGVGSIECFIYQNGESQRGIVEFVDCYLMVLVPSAFTPGGDGLNDCWRPVIHSYGEGSIASVSWQVRALDGTLVFDSQYMGNYWEVCWDGSYNDEHAKSGTYLYHIRISFEGEEDQVFTGMFILLK